MNEPEPYPESIYHDSMHAERIEWSADRRVPRPERVEVPAGADE